MADALTSPKPLKPGKDYPGLSCGALIFNDKGELLLIERSEKSKFDAGFWTMIVGGVEYGDSFAETIQREAMEEANIQIQIEGVIRWVEMLPRDTGVHWIGPDILAKQIGGNLKNNEPETHRQLGWFPLNKLPSPISPSTQETIDAYLKQKGN